MAKLRTFGKTVLFSTDGRMSGEKIVKLYQDKNEVEDQFKQLNNPGSIAFRPRYHWTDTKIKVYSLICVLALLVLQFMNYQAKKASLDMSNTVLRSELADIKEVSMIYSLTQVVRKVTVLSTVQQRLFVLFDLDKYAPKDTITTLSLRRQG